MRIICCKFGNKFNQWHVDNLKHMIDNYSGLKYDSFEVIEDDLYGNWFNKFQMYDRFRDGENLYFDLDDRKLSNACLNLWNNKIDSDNDLGSINERLFGTPTYFGFKFTKGNEVNKTIIANDNTILFDYPRLLNKVELCSIGSYPQDYKFLKLKPEYLIGMSVPPVMTAQIASQIHEQWLSKI